MTRSLSRDSKGGVVRGREGVTGDGLPVTGEEDRGGAAKYVRELLGIPEKYEVLCAIALGYPDEEKSAYDLDRLKYEKIHNEEW